MLGQVGIAQRGRRLLLFSVPPSLVALVVWLVGLVPHSTLFSTALLAFAVLGVVEAALIADPPRAQAEPSREALDRQPERERTRVLIVGASASALRAAQELESSGEHDVVGFVADNYHEVPECLRVLGATDDIPVLVRRHGIQQVVVAEAPAWQQQLSEMVSEGTAAPVDVLVVPGLYEARVGRLRFQRVRDLPLVDLAPAQPSIIYTAMKRGVDLMISTVGLILTAPAIALASLAVKMSSPGPVLFRQERVGKGGRSFTIFKLRTMVVDAEKNTGPVLSAGAADSRITPVGKLLRATRLDELPQLVNVLQGEMSIVGPRPERPCFVRRYEQEIPGYRERHQVPPGITGLAQVNAGYAIDAEMKLRYDLLYVYNRSLWLDLKLMFQTLATMCRRTGQ
jgi:exopolysaccharide biosynthesis polyprenyl glycosylphosphotransferase